MKLRHISVGAGNNRCVAVCRSNNKGMTFVLQANGSRLSVLATDLSPIASAQSTFEQLHDGHQQPHRDFLCHHFHQHQHHRRRRRSSRLSMMAADLVPPMSVENNHEEGFDSHDEEAETEEETKEDVSIVTCVRWCTATRQIAVARQSIVSIYEEDCSGCFYVVSELQHGFDVLVLAWSPAGSLLLAGGISIALWKYNNCDRSDDHNNGEASSRLNRNDTISFHSSGGSDEATSAHVCPWSNVWRELMPNPVSYLSFSPDGRLFASAANNDKLVKVWSRRTSDYSRFFDRHDEWQFDSLFLSHPRAVTTIEWRDNPMSTVQSSDGFVFNSILTSCRDGVGRVWHESSRQELFLFYLCAVMPTESSGVTSALLHWVCGRELAEAINCKKEATTVESSSLELNCGPMHLSHLDRYDSRNALLFMSSDGESSQNLVPDLVLSILRNGTVLLWRLEGLEASKRCAVTVTLVTRVPSGVPQSLACTISATAYIFHDGNTNIQLVSPKLSTETENNMNQLSWTLSVLFEHDSGDLTRWRFSFTGVAARSAICTLRFESRIGGHKRPVHHVVSHPRLPLMLSTNITGNEAILWQVSSICDSLPSLISSADPAPFSLAHPTELPRLPLYELARSAKSRFCHLAWLPTRDPLFVAFNECGLSVWTCRNNSSEVNSADQHRLWELTCIGTVPEHWDSGVIFHLVHVFSCNTALLSVSATRENDTEDMCVIALVNGVLLSWIFCITSSNLTDDQPRLIHPPQRLADISLGIGVTCADTFGSWSESILAQSNQQLPWLIVTGHKDGHIEVWNTVLLSCIDHNYKFKWHSVLKWTDHHSFSSSPVTLLRCAYAGRLAFLRVNGEAVILESESTGGEVFIVEWRSNDSSAYNGIRTMDWLCLRTGRHALTLATSRQLVILAQHDFSFDHERNDPWDVVHSVMLPRALCCNGNGCDLSIHWTAGGELAIASEGAGICIFSPWVEQQSNAANYESRGAMVSCRFRSERGNEDMRNLEPSDVFRLAQLSRRSVPIYHPWVLEELVAQGRLETVKLLLGHVDDWAHSEESHSPTLPLSKLLEKDADLFFASSNSSNKVKTDYSGLFSSVRKGNTCDFSTSLGDVEEVRIMVDGDVVFNEKTSSALCDALVHKGLPGLNGVEQLRLSAFVGTLGKVEANKAGLDANGIRYLLALRRYEFLCRCLPVTTRPLSLSTQDFCWAYHSEAQETLIGHIKDTLTAFSWTSLRARGVFLWIRSTTHVKRLAELLAKSQFSMKRDPFDCLLFYMALGKQTILAGLFRMAHNSRMADFFSNDFSIERWRTAALKNAFALLGKRRFEHSAAFFLLGGSLKDAVHVCMKNLNDFQLALAICRLHESEFGPQAISVLEQHVVPFASMNDYIWLASISLSLLSRHNESASVFLDDYDDITIKKKLNYNTESTLLLRVDTLSRAQRGHKGFGIAAMLRFMAGLAHVYIDTSMLKQYERRLLFRVAYEYERVGVPLLALTVLKDIARSKLEAAKSTKGGSNTACGISHIDFVSKSGRNSLKDTKMTDMISSGTFNFDSFNGNFGISTEPVVSPMPEIKLPIEDLTARVSTNLTVPNRRDAAMLEQLTLRIWLQLLSDAILMRRPTLSWPVFREQLADDYDALKTLKPLHCDISEEEDAFSHVGGPLLSFTTSHTLLTRQVQLLGALSLAKRIPGLLQSISFDIIILMSKHRNAPFAPRGLRSRRLSSFSLRSNVTGGSQHAVQAGAALSCALHNALVNTASSAPDASRSLSDLRSHGFLTEVAVSIYVAAFIHCTVWDGGKLLCLLRNVLSSDFFDKIFNGDISPMHEAWVPTDELLVMFYSSSESESENENESESVHDSELENDINDGDDLGETSDHCYYARLLLCYMAVQHVLIGIQALIASSGFGTLHLQVTSPMLHTVLVTLETWASDLNMRLSNIPLPIALQTSVPQNPFPHHLQQWRDERQAWDYLVSQEQYSRTALKFKLFTPPASESVSSENIATSTTGTTTVFSHGERMICFCADRSASSDDATLSVALARDMYEIKAESSVAHFVTEAFALSEPVPLPRSPEISIPTTPDAPRIPKSLTVAGSPFPVTPSSPLLRINSSSSAPSPSELLKQQNHGYPFVSVRRQLTNSVTWVESHPYMPFYLTGASDHTISLWQFNQPTCMHRYRSPSSAHHVPRVTRIRFSPSGGKFGVTDSSGDLWLWRFDVSSGASPYQKMQCHAKTANDFAFLNSTSFLATAGDSGEAIATADGGNGISLNVCLWDSLIPPERSLVHGFTCPDMNVLEYTPRHQTLIAGGRRGALCLFDIRSSNTLCQLNAHESSITALAVDNSGSFMVTGCTQGYIKIWSLKSRRLLSSYSGIHMKSGFFSSKHDNGISQILIIDEFIYSCGADGTLKRILIDIEWIND